MKSKYTSGKWVGKNQTVPIGVDDPRLKPGKIGQTKARQGAEIDIIGLDGKSLIGGGRNLNNPAGRVPPAPPGPDVPNVVTPPMDNQPPKTYPGGSGPVIIVPTDPTNVSVVWSGNDLVISFNWDYANDTNSTVSQFIVELTSGGVTRRTPSNTYKPNKTQTAQTITVTKSMITSMFNVFKTSFSAVCVLSCDPLNNVSNSVCAPTVPAYVLDLPVPVITVTSISSGYSVSYTTPTQDSFDAIEIVEYESTDTTEPTGVTYTRTFFDTLNPAIVITPNFNKRWVKARFSSDGGIYTAYSAAVAVTPTVIGSVDLTPPNEVTNIVATWSGDNIVIDYKLPAQDAGSRVQIELTSPNSLVGFFYRFPDGSGRDQTTTITKKDLLDQFGQHYSSFSGVLRSIDSAGNRSDGTSFNVAQRANPLLGVVPTFSITPLTNGYSVFATNYESTPGVTYMEVYAKHTPWVGDPLNENDLVYAGSNPAVIIDTVYTTVYVKVRYYDDFNNTSSYSNQSGNSTTPIDSGIVTSFENPITFGVNGVIYAGADYNSGNRTLFKTGGIFAYDSVNTSPSTQILSNASAGTPTFITNQAQIAGWTIDSTKIQKLVSGKYTGMESGSTYSFYAGSTTSGGDANAKFLVTPAGEVTAREITIIGNGSPSSNLISAGGLFTVTNDGKITATSANIQGVLKADSGEFLGNVLIKSGGSLYSPQTAGTIPGPSIPGVIFNSQAISAFNADGGYTQIYVTPLTDSSKSTFKTTAADIGGWKVNQSSISRSGTATISLNSTAGNISVSAQNVLGYTSGINGPYVSSGSTPSDNINGTPVGTENVFWAGTDGATGTSNAFRVTLAGNLYASNAKITGTIASVGAEGTMTMDGQYGYMSLKTAGTNAPISYLVPRNNNIYLTGPSTTEPWSTGKQISSSGPTNAPYIAAGSTFKDYWNNTPVSGVGMYTGAWDYFTTGSSKPFITASTTGIQLSVSPSLGLLLDGGTAATGDKLTPAIPNGTPSMLFYTARRTTIGSNGAPVYSPDTEYGAWASFTNNTIKLTADSDTFININGATSRIDMKATTDIWQSLTSDGIRIQVDSTIAQEFNSVGIKIQSTANIWQQFTSSGIRIQSSTDNYISVGSSSIVLQASSQVVVGSGVGQGGAFPAGGASAYAGASKITMDPTYGVVISGIMVQRDLDMTDAGAGGSYRNTPPLGRYPRSRMLIEDPVTGQVMLGMGVYYRTGVTSTPTSDTGYAGDLLVQY